MKNYNVLLTDGRMVEVQAWDASSAYEFAQDLYETGVLTVIEG